jgi:hypothetical protein
VIYGEKKQNALKRLLQEIMVHSGDNTTLDLAGKSFRFNSGVQENCVGLQYHDMGQAHGFCARHDGHQDAGNIVVA